MTNVRRTHWAFWGYVLVAVSAVCTALGACSSPTPQSGTNTNWMEQCTKDSDCKSGSCMCGVCTTACSSPSDCSSIAGSKCVSAADAPTGCVPSGGVCLLECTKDADCSASGPGVMCGRNACTHAICTAAPRPPCPAGVDLCNNWQTVQTQFPKCLSSATQTVLANCGPYYGVATYGKDGYEADFFDRGSGELVGHGIKGVTGVICAAYDPSFVFPQEECAPLDCVADAAAPLADASARDGGSVGPFPEAAADGTLSSALAGAVLRSVVATDAGWVAVGQTNDDRPLVMTSSDAKHWTVADAPVSQGWLPVVAFGNGTLVIINSGGGQAARILTRSPNGTWHVESIGTNNDQVLFGNGVFLTTAGVEPGAKVSSNGIDWSPVPLGAQWFGFVDGRFIAFNWWDAGTNPSTTVPGFRTSADGLTWSDPIRPSAPILSMVSLARVGDQLLGFARESCDGGPCATDGPDLQLLGPRTSLLSDLTATPIAWAPVYEREWRPAIATDGTLVFAISVTSFYSTTLPIGSAAWKEAMVLGYLGILNDIAYASGTFVAVGQQPGDSVSPAMPLVATRTATTGWVVVPL